jgi:hypothetical protein
MEASMEAFMEAVRWPYIMRVEAGANIPISLKLKYGLFSLGNKLSYWNKILKLWHAVIDSKDSRVPCMDSTFQSNNCSRPPQIYF